MGPPVEIFLTTIASQPALRQRQEYLLRSLQINRIPYISYDLASDEDAKKRWRRKAPGGKIEIPGILVGGQYAGPWADFEDAVEHEEIHQFLRTKEEWDSELSFTIDPSIPVIPKPSDSTSNPPAAGSTSTTSPFTGGAVHHQKVIGVPGALPPSQMTKPSLLGPLNVGPRKTKDQLAKEREQDKNAFDVGEELTGFGLQGVKVTHDELNDLVKELEAELGNWEGGKKKARKVVKQEEKPVEAKEEVKEAKQEESKQEIKEVKPEETSKEEETKDAKPLDTKAESVAEKKEETEGEQEKEVEKEKEKIAPTELKSDSVPDAPEAA